MERSISVLPEANRRMLIKDEQKEPDSCPQKVGGWLNEQAQSTAREHTERYRDSVVRATVSYWIALLGRMSQRV